MLTGNDMTAVNEKELQYPFIREYPTRSLEYHLQTGIAWISIIIVNVLT